jgi:hypothetical protein
MICPLSSHLLDAGILASRQSDYSDEGEIDIDSARNSDGFGGELTAVSGRAGTVRLQSSLSSAVVEFCHAPYG